jgi:hypothetical protein
MICGILFVSNFNEITPSITSRNNIKVKEKFCVVLVYSYHKSEHMLTRSLSEGVPLQRKRSNSGGMQWRVKSSENVHQGNHRSFIALFIWFRIKGW